MKVDAAHAALNRADTGTETLHLSDAGGLRQFGCYVETLPPGEYSSDRHWHSAEDEFLFLLSGTTTVIDDDGEHVLFPGDACAWRRGDANAHHLVNRGDTPCRYLILGSRVANDICRYPDLGRVQSNFETTWQVAAADGTILRSGDLPPALLHLSPDWGAPPDPAFAPRRIQRASARVWVAEGPYTHPILDAGLGPYRHSVMGDPGGLTQFGVHLEELPPGSHSAFRHWHEAEDEMVYILSGHPVLVEETETQLNPGDAACWPAGTPVGHCLANRSDTPTVYLTIGTRLLRDRIHYPDHDLITEKDGPARRYSHADGRPRTKGDHE